MTKYVAFLRAVNVGGKSVMKMSDLKQMFESFGLQNVQTFIQSGNVVFETDEQDVSALEQKIEHQLETAVGKKIQLFVRTMRQVGSIVKGCPFHPKEGQVVHIVLLATKPTRKSIEALMAFRSESDDFAVKGREAYNLRRNRERSIFSNHSMEQILGIPGTTRNLNTLKKLAEKYT